MVYLNGTQDARATKMGVFLIEESNLYMQRTNKTLGDKITRRQRLKLIE